MKPKLFIADLNNRADEFREYLPVNINLRYETIAPHLAMAETQFIRPLLGSALFARLVDWYETTNTTSSDTTTSSDDDTADSTIDYMQHLCDLVRFALIRLALWKGFDSIAANISDTGISSSVEKDFRLYRYQEELLRNSLKVDGFNQLDIVLAFLEDNLNEFPEFTNSDFYTGNADTLIHSTSEFNRIYNIDDSRLVFLKLVPFMRDVELLKLQQRIGDECYQDIKTNADIYTDVMPYIKNYIAYMAVADGIGELHKMPTEKGLIYESSSAEGYDVNPVDTQQLNSTRAQFATKADRYLDAALNKMKADPEKFNLFYTFSGNSPADDVIHLDNTNRKIFMT